MITREHAQLMAEYNRWMNAKLYAAAATLTDAERKADRGAFFKSIHGTLVHLLVADLAWYYRFTGRSLDGLRAEAARCEDFAHLCARRAAVDIEIEAWAATLTPDWLAADFTYYTMADGAKYTRPAWLLVTHLFNHETHHRGQVTTLLTQLGVDVGATDLPVLPRLAARYGDPVRG